MLTKTHWAGIGLAVLVVAGSVAYLMRDVNSSLYEYFDRHGYFHHDKVSNVNSDSWPATEYRDCTNKNTKTSDDQPQLVCGSSGGEIQKLFKVRFKGVAHDKNQSESTTFYWKCRRNQDGDDPGIICDPPKATWP